MYVQVVTMQFEWDENKNAINIQKHGIDFNDVLDMFNHPMVIQQDTRFAYYEDRWIGIGWLRYQIGVVVYTEREGDTIRIISARLATKQEVKRYEQSL